MTFCLKSLSRAQQVPVGSTAGAAKANLISRFLYATDDAAATVETAGYFNNARSFLAPGDQINCSFAISGTPVSKTLVVLTVPATGNITVGQSSVTAG